MTITMISACKMTQKKMCHTQGCGAVKIFDGSGSDPDSDSGKAFRLRLQVKRPEGSDSEKNVPAPGAPAPAPHILNVDPLKSSKFDPLQKNPVHYTNSGSMYASILS